jgi:predicted esterase
MVPVGASPGYPEVDPYPLPSLSITHSPRIKFIADSINPTASVQPQIKLKVRMATTLKAPFIDASVDAPAKSSPTMNSETNEAVPSNATTIVALSGKNHTHTVIFLHGREDFGSDLAQYFFDSKASDGRSLAEIYPSVRWVFPTAKLRYSAQRDFEFSNSSLAEALKGEEIISQWFDVWNITTPEDKEDLMIPGLKESIGKVLEIIKEEAQEIPLERIILGGISQGCATAILTLLSSGMDFGGLLDGAVGSLFRKRSNAFQQDASGARTT